MSEPKITLKTKDGSNKKTIEIYEEKSNKTNVTQNNISVPKATNTNEVQWNSTINRSKPLNNERKIDWVKLAPIIGAVIGAILIGSILGFSILSLFSDSEVRSQNSIDSHLPLKPVHGHSNQYELSKVIPLNAFVMQAGHYKSKKKATEVARNYRAKGLSAVVSGEKSFRVLLGVATSQQQGRKLATTYQKKGVHVFVKQWNFQAQKPVFSAEAITVINAGHQLFRSLSDHSTKHLGAKADKKVEFNDELNQYHHLMNQYQEGWKRLKPHERTAILEMIRSLDLTVQSSIEVEKHMTTPLLLQMQEGLVRYIMAYKRLVEKTT